MNNMGRELEIYEKHEEENQRYTNNMRKRIRYIRITWGRKLEIYE